MAIKARSEEMEKQKKKQEEDKLQEVMKTAPEKWLEFAIDDRLSKLEGVCVDMHAIQAKHLQDVAILDERVRTMDGQIATHNQASCCVAHDSTHALYPT